MFRLFVEVFVNEKRDNIFECTVKMTSNNSFEYEPPEKGTGRSEKWRGW